MSTSKTPEKTSGSKKKTTTAKKKKTSKNQHSRWRNVSGIALLSLGVFIIVSLLTFNPEDPPLGSLDSVKNGAGPIGAWLAVIFGVFSFGQFTSLIIPMVFILFGIDTLRNTGYRLSLKMTAILFGGGILVSSIWEMTRVIIGHVENMNITGIIGVGLTRHLLLEAFGNTGALIVLAALLLMYVTFVLRVHWIAVARNVAEFFRRISESLPKSDPEKAEEKRKLREEKKAARLALAEEKRAEKEEQKAAREAEKEAERERKEEEKAQKEAEKAQQEKLRAEEAALKEAEVLKNLQQDEDPDKDVFSDPPVAPALPEHQNKFTIPVEEDPPPVIDGQKPKQEELQQEKEEEINPSVYMLPSIDLLVPSDSIDDDVPDVDELDKRGKLLEDRLAEFSVKAEVIDIHPGPVVTRYDLRPAAGVKVGKIATLDKELAMSLAVANVRIQAPIPGTGAVGIEVPNKNPAMVRLHDIVSSEKFDNFKGELPIALGKTAQGDVFISDLAKMPHVLIAGTTGSGKSVCINTIIASILLKKKPEEVLIAMVDPKKIELSAYAELRRYHLIYIDDADEVIATEPKNAVMLLKSIVKEMENRYDYLAETGLRNIGEYNEKVEQGKLAPADGEEERKKLPYIVMIIDELADLMITAAKEVEEPIARLAQMARAVGIHLVVATQRPSVDVITGVIKANFPARIGFKVRQKIDSRTILDAPGADALLGKGDSLVLSGSSIVPVRVHGAFITTDETHNLIGHISRQPKFVKNCKLEVPESDAADGPSGFEPTDARDQLFEEALNTVLRHKQGSVSLLQRRLKVGYSRAGRILDQLEQAGVVGPFEGSKARDVLITEDDVDRILNPERYLDPED